jgi:hypothetical protein
MRHSTLNSPSRPIRLCVLVGFACLIACSERVTPEGPETVPPNDASAIWPNVGEGSTADDGNSASNPWVTFDGSGGVASDGDPILNGRENEGAGGQTAAEMGGTQGAGADGGAGAPGAGGSSEDSGSSEQTSAAGGAESLEPIKPAPRLRFYEYFEGSGSAKALGVENLNNEEALDCRVEIYSNGGTDPWRLLPISLVSASPGRAVLCTTSLSRPDCTDPIGGSTFNGNDALILRCSDQIMDSFGRVGEDPGDAWGGRSAADLTSQDQRLLRCSDGPDLDPFDAFFLDDWVPWGEGEDEATARERCDSAPGGLGGAPTED